MRQFTEEQNIFRASFRLFLEKEIQPYMKQWRDNSIVDREAFKKAGEYGFLMVWPDEKYGAIGNKDFRYEQIIIEEHARAGTGEFATYVHSRLVGPYIDKFGSEDQKNRWLEDCVSGEKILAVAMTEPSAGSDLSGMKSTLIEQHDGSFLLNGSKIYITNGINADLIVVAAKNNPDDPYAVTLCVVERGMQGFERGSNLKKMGMKAQDTAELFFNDVRIPKENVLGEVGSGFYYLMDSLAEERLIVACICASQSRRAFDVTRDFVMQRQAFGRSVSKFQNTQFKMAEMEAELDMLQVYLDACIDLHNKAKLTAERAAKLKLQASEVESRMMDLGVQLHGGAGFMEEYEICYMYTCSRISRIFGGSSEIMKLIIGRDIFSENYVSILD